MFANALRIAATVLIVPLVFGCAGWPSATSPGTASGESHNVAAFLGLPDKLGNSHRLDMFKPNEASQAVCRGFDSLRPLQFLEQKSLPP